MKELLVSIERGGERIPLGFIRGEGSADARFAYSDTWLCATLVSANGWPCGVLMRCAAVSSPRCMNQPRN